MDRGSGAMDAGQDVWDWEVLPDHMTSSMCHDTANLADHQETNEPTVMLPPSDADVHNEPVDECKDIGVVLDETVPNKEEAMPELTDPSEAEEEEEKTSQSPDAKQVRGETFDEEEGTGGEDEVEEKTIQSTDTENAQDEKKLDKEEGIEGEAEEQTFGSSDFSKKAHDEKFHEEDDAIKKKDNIRARPGCVVFSVGKLKVNGIGALCSFGVAAATVCIFLIGGKLQHHHRQQQQQKIQLQFYGDDKTIHQVVQQTSRLNQAMSSVMGGGASARANISFGGFYDGL